MLRKVKAQLATRQPAETFWMIMSWQMQTARRARKKSFRCHGTSFTATPVR